MTRKGKLCIVPTGCAGRAMIASGTFYSHLGATIDLRYALVELGTRMPNVLIEGWLTPMFKIDAVLRGFVI